MIVNSPRVSNEKLEKLQKMKKMKNMGEMHMIEPTDEELSHYPKIKPPEDLSNM